MILNMKSINPNFPCKVFVFPIGNYRRENIKEETKKYWKITDKYKEISIYEYAVGVEKSISKSAYKLMGWRYTDDEKYEGKCEFEGNEFIDLKGFSWKIQTELAGQFWTRGNHLVVEFDGNGKFRLERPGTNREWFNCCNIDDKQSSNVYNLIENNNGNYELAPLGNDVEIVVKKKPSQNINIKIIEEVKKE